MGARSFRPDPLVAMVLSTIAIALFLRVEFPPDLSPGQTEPPAAVADDPPIQVQDFAYVFNYARRAAWRAGVSPYSIAEHRDFLQAWLGPKVTSALCFAYGPSMVMLLAPLFAMSTAWAWLAWNLAGALLTASTVSALSDDSGVARRWGRLAATGATAFHTLVNGQTALVTTGLLGAMHAADRTIRGRIARPLAVAACIAALALKPPLAVVGLIALLLAHRTRAVAASCLVLVLIGAGAMVWWTPSAVWDYAALLRRYNLVDADPIMRAGFVPTDMSNLRGVLLNMGLANDSVAFRLSAWTFAACLVAAAMFRIVRPAVMPLHVAMSCAALAYLLFAPHLTSTEDLLLLVPLTVFLAHEPLPGWRRSAMIAGCVGPQWVNASGMQVLALGGASLAWHAAAPMLAFALKVLVALLVGARAVSLTATDAAPASAA